MWSESVNGQHICIVQQKRMDICCSPELGSPQMGALLQVPLPLGVAEAPAQFGHRSGDSLAKHQDKRWTLSRCNKHLCCCMPVTGTASASQMHRIMVQQNQSTPLSSMISPKTSNPAGEYMPFPLMGQVEADPLEAGLTTPLLAEGRACARGNMACSRPAILRSSTLQTTATSTKGYH